MAERRYSNELLDRTIETYQPYYAQPLTRDDAQLILSRMVAFVRQLHQMDKEATPDDVHAIWRTSRAPRRRPET